MKWDLSINIENRRRLSTGELSVLLVDGFAVDSKDRNLEISGVTTTQPTPISYETGLGQNHPNPFNPTTTIRYSLAEGSRVVISIYDVSGRLVRALVSEFKKAGGYSVDWNGKDSRGNAVSSGVYFYQMKTGDVRITKKMVLLKYGNGWSQLLFCKSRGERLRTTRMPNDEGGQRGWTT